MRDLLAYLLYGAIALLALLGIFEIYNSIIRSSNIEEFRQQVTEYKTEMNQNYLRVPGRYGTSQFLPSNLIIMGIAPTSAQLDANTLTNPWNGNSAVYGVNNANFALDNDNIDQASCIAILRQFTADMGIVQFQVGANIAGAASGAPVPPGSDDNTIINACANPVNGIRLLMQ
ncbi:MAG: type 4 pilus major pilin [Magnetospirillum sp.]|nr:type 4 pilus major pilin [Magnetospirillum sp.]